MSRLTWHQYKLGRQCMLILQWLNFVPAFFVPLFLHVPFKQQTVLTVGRGATLSGQMQKLYKQGRGGG